MCLKEIGLSARNLLIILDSIISIMIGATYLITQEKENLHFDNESDQFA
jgi:hypothetical protein